MKTATMKRGKVLLLLFGLVVFLSGCGAGSQSGAYVAQGRQALFAGNNQGALGDFQAAAQADPNYVYGAVLTEGVYSFLGRAQYLTGQYAQARQSLEKDLAQRPGDSLARLYLGLTLARLGDRPSGLKDIEAGTKGIGDFVDNIVKYPEGTYWDPARTIRNSVSGNLKMISSGNIDWPTLIANSESLAIAFEQEQDRAEKQAATSGR
jgi:tetratricopeptide (TPR) repeat protein